MRGRTPAFIAFVIGSVLLGGGPAAAQAQAVDVRDNSFAPSSVTITPGDTVT